MTHRTLVRIELPSLRTLEVKELCRALNSFPGSTQFISLELSNEHDDGSGGSISRAVSVESGGSVRLHEKGREASRLGMSAYRRGRVLVGQSCRTVTYVDEHNRVVMFPDGDPARRVAMRFPSNRPLTRLASNNVTENSVLCGDSSGRIFHCSLDEPSNKLVRSQAHWHSLPIEALAWGPEGEYFYSGGGEAVVVKWSLAEMAKVCQAPRLGEVIVDISTTYSQVIVCFADCSVKCFSHQLELTAHLSMMLTVDLSGRSGVLWHTPTSTVAYFKGEKSVNFFDPRLRKDLASIDVSDHDTVRGNRESEAPVRKEAVCFSLSQDGNWMATAEGANVKMWRFFAQGKEFRLDAQLLSCHDDTVNGLAVHEHEPDAVLLLTRSDDGDIKLWTSSGDTGWHIVHTFRYKQRSASSALALSCDATVLASCYGDAVVLFSMANFKLRSVLCSSKIQTKKSSSVPTLMFGRRDLCHHLYCASSDSVAVWNCVTSELMLTLDVPLAKLRVTPTDSTLIVSAGTVYQLTRCFQLEEVFSDAALADIVGDDRNNMFAVRTDGEVYKIDGHEGEEDSAMDIDLSPPKGLLSQIQTLKQVQKPDTRDVTKWITADVQLSRPLYKNLESLLKQSL